MTRRLPACVSGSTAPVYIPGKRGAATSRKVARRAKSLDYKTAGVDIDAGNELVQRIKRLNPDIGGFNGLFPFGTQRSPVVHTVKSNEGIAMIQDGDSYLVAGTDGVGTKLKLAFETGIHDTIGVDLVAMCVNDIVVCGARPLFFLDYYATASLDVDVAERVVRGINDGCRQCGALLMGGETAEMPGMYTPGEYDLAGFAVGAVSKDAVITGQDIAPGDKLIGLPSSGVHSNGFSLVRKVMERAGLGVHDAAPWMGGSDAMGRILLTPTRIYVNDVLRLHNDVGMKGAVHVTGGGFTENLPRVVPSGRACVIDRSAWDVPPLFRWLQTAGDIADAEMFRTFNMGVGMVCVVEAGNVDAALACLSGAFVLGEVRDGDGVQYVEAL